MTHDPLCMDHGLVNLSTYDCTCAEITTIREDMLAKVFNNPDCVWGQGECVPDCPCCKRLDELIAERGAGYKEAVSDCITAVEMLEPETQFSGPYQMRRAAVAALRALQDKP